MYVYDRSILTSTSSLNIVLYVFTIHLYFDEYIFT